MSINSLAPTHSHELDLFRFVTIRNGVLPTAAQSTAFISYPNEEAKNTLYTQLATLEVTAKDLAQQVAAHCQSFKTSAAYLSNEAAIAETVDIAAAKLIFNGTKNEVFAVEYLHKNSARLNKNTDSTLDVFRLWDNFFFQLIEGKEDTKMLEILCLGIKMSHLSANASNDTIGDFLDTAIIIPQAITNLLNRRNNAIEVHSEVPSRQEVVEDAKGDTLFLQFVTALKELKTAKSRFYQKQKNRPIANDQIDIAPTEKEPFKLAAPVTDDLHTREAQINAQKPTQPPILIDVILAKLSAPTLALLEAQDLIADTTMEYAIETIEGLLSSLAFEYKNIAEENVAVVNGSTFRVSGTSGLADGSPLANDTAYIPIQVADFRVVRQKVICYKAGEVAHIENIMAGEMKERATRRLQHTEDSYSSSTERETMQEKDSQTTERFELQREMREVINSDISTNGNVSVMSGDLTTKVTVSGGFATNYSELHSNSTASSYAKNTVDRALSRFQERVKEERTHKVITEYEELQKHILDNRGNDKHVSGLYRWVDKVFENQLYNYGKRAILEFTIPEPAAFYLTP